MLKFPHGRPQTPLIEDQRIWYLDAPPEHAEECLEPELFALAREARKKNHNAFARHQMPTGCEWKEVPDRGRFLINPESRLLCLTIDAGIGKTTAMIQAQSLRGGWMKGHLVIAVQFDNLPVSATAYCGEDGWLVDRWIENFHHKKTPNRQVAWQLIQRKIATQQFTLIVDSLDQTSQVQPQKRAESLAKLLETVCPTAQCIVSGRPQSIQLYWTYLFDLSGPWKFAQIDQFSPDQINRFLGEKRAALLKRLEADVISNPRMLEMILKIPDEDLPRIQTAADIYWRAIDATLKKDLRSQSSGVMKKRPALFWFSMLAFESLRQGYTNGIPKGNPMETFLEKLLETYRPLIDKTLKRSGNGFDDELVSLGKLNSFILHAVLDSSHTLEQLKFRDRSMQDFFAALWVSKYSCTAEQKTWLRKQLRPDDVTDPAIEVVIDQKESQFFRLAAGMPADAIEDGEIWADSLSVVYESSQHRSTELIYRCWPNLLRSAEYSTPDQVFEMQQIAPTTKAQREVRAWVDKLVGTHVEATAEEKSEALDTALVSIEPVAKRVLYRFLSEFPAMIQGLHGSDKQRIAKEFDDGFVPVPEKESPELVFSSTDESNNVIHITIPAPFQMAQYQVTNELYSLFFPASRTRKEDDPIARARCAAANINWYDAWSATLFFLGRLASSDEWEMACRGRPGKVKDPYQWCFGNEESDLLKYAVFELKDHWASVEVGQRLPWSGLYDMHGNVYEWCSNWFSKNRDDENLAELVGSARCLRGGTFRNTASGLRCVLRGRGQPVDASHYYGFRVARADRNQSLWRRQFSR